MPACSMAWLMTLARGRSTKGPGFGERPGQFRPRTVDGTWLTPYDPVAADEQFHEGGAYQYQWLVPQDPAGLVAQMGGRRATQTRLDENANPRLALEALMLRLPAVRDGG